MGNPPTPLDEKAARQILARAVELENQQRGALTELQVRDIARELDIPERAIEQALAEYRDAGGSTKVERPGLPRWRTRAALVAFAAIGILAIALVLFTVVVRIAVPPQ